MKETFKALGFIFLGAFVLSFIGLYNGYPLVYSDTGTYLYSGFDKFVPNDRPISYGLFCYFFSFKTSAWLIVIFQNLITSYFIYLFAGLFKYKWNKNYVFLGLTILLTFTTAVGWYSNQLMPDFFTPLIIIGFIFILFGKSSRKNLITSAIITLFAITTHFSHLLIYTSLALIALIFFLIIKQTQLKKGVYLNLMIAGLSWFAVPTINYIVEDNFVSSKGSHVFLMSHLCGTGILEDFLKEKCDTDDYKDCKICEFKDQLPRDPATFIWSTNIVEKCGGWEGSKEEFEKIIAGTLKDPNFLTLNIFRSTTYGLAQLTHNKVGEGLTPYIEHSAPYGQIHWRFNNEINDYLMSKQNAWGGQNLKFDFINSLQSLLLFVCLVVLLLILKLRQKIERNLLFILLIILAGIIINSFITAGLNTAYPRYQARVVWLLPFTLILLVGKERNIFIQAIKNTFKS